MRVEVDERVYHVPRLALTLINQRSMWTTRVIYGAQGSGKTTYAYYSIKFAHLLNEYKHTLSEKTLPDALRVALKKYDVCIGRDCKMDQVDEEIRDYLIISENDYIRLLDIVDSVQRSNRPLPWIWIDDIMLNIEDFRAGGWRRALYVAMKTFIQFYRAVARHVVVTTTTPTQLPKLMRQTATSYIQAKRFPNCRDDVETHSCIRYMNYSLYLVFVKDKDVGYVQKGIYNISWVDVMPYATGRGTGISYAMPKWLEEEIDARKRKIIEERLKSVLETESKEKEKKERKKKAEE